MSDMFLIEYDSLLKREAKLKERMKFYEKGYISMKNIKGKTYYYLQSRVGDKVKSQYIKSEDVQEVMTMLEERNEAKSELPKVQSRMKDLEDAALLVDKTLYKDLVEKKYCYKMDTLPTEVRESCAYFANSINGIEGVPISKEAGEIVNQWVKGKITYQEGFDRIIARHSKIEG